MSRAGLRPIGFLLLMLGFGLRLDSTWDALAGLLLAAGAVASTFGLFAARHDGNAFTGDDAAR